jgi:hypothetical protein
MTVAIKITDSQRLKLGTMFLLDILADGKRVGSASVCKYHDTYYFGDSIEEYVHLERLNIDDEPHGKGYETAAIKALVKKFGRVVAAPDYEDARRLCERSGEGVENMIYFDF